MRKGLTELVFILDRSGSMSGLESDTIGGFNSMITKQKKLGHDALVSTILFNHESKVVHDRIPLKNVPMMTEEDYEASGCTALIDAIGESVKHIRNIHKYIREEDTPEHALFVITTDGMENASRHFDSDTVKNMVKEQQEKGWEFLFLGANIDSVETAKSFGIHERNAVNFHNDSRGILGNFAALGAICQSMMATGRLDEHWKNELEKDFQNRKSAK